MTIDIDPKLKEYFDSLIPKPVRDYRTTPARLRALKEAIPATWPELATLFGVHPKTLLRWLRGESTAAPQHVRRLGELERGLVQLETEDGQRPSGSPKETT